MEKAFQIEKVDLVQRDGLPAAKNPAQRRLRRLVVRAPTENLREIVHGRDAGTASQQAREPYPIGFRLDGHGRRLQIDSRPRQTQHRLLTC